MITNLPLFQVYGAMARHSAEGLKVSATNIANADQPGYKAAKVESFEAFLSRTTAQPRGLSTPFQILTADTPASPNGNSVSLEYEMFASSDALGQHNLALSVYSKSLDLLRTAIGKRG
ncbi:MAG: flagellar biosynthesis protein FlgB [Hyphomonadaceae bacterium]